MYKQEVQEFLEKQYCCISCWTNGLNGLCSCGVAFCQLAAKHSPFSPSHIQGFSCLLKNAALFKNVIHIETNQLVSPLPFFANATGESLVCIAGFFVLFFSTLLHLPLGWISLSFSTSLLFSFLWCLLSVTNRFKLILGEPYLSVAQVLPTQILYCFAHTHRTTCGTGSLVGREKCHAFTLLPYVKSSPEISHCVTTTKCILLLSRFNNLSPLKPFPSFVLPKNPCSNDSDNLVTDTVLCKQDITSSLLANFYFT